MSRVPIAGLTSVEIENIRIAEGGLEFSRVRCLPGYELLAIELDAALTDAQVGKGAERHADPGVPFEEQHSMLITRLVGIGYPLGQALKKIIESQRLPKERARLERLGAMTLLAMANIHDRGER